jgi:type I restriction enzyme R subunit
MEALILGNIKSDYPLFIDGKAIAFLEAKRKENELKTDVETQAEQYAHTPQKWYGLWCNGFVPLVYMSHPSPNKSALYLYPVTIQSPKQTDLEIMKVKPEKQLSQL